MQFLYNRSSPKIEIINPQLIFFNINFWWVLCIPLERNLHMLLRSCAGQAKMKKRMVVVGGIIVVVIVLMFAILSSGMNSKVVSVSDATSGNYTGKKVQVTGVVVNNSYSVDSNGTLAFSIADEDDTAQETVLEVSYEKGVGATFGNGVTAICTGRIEADGHLECTELVTKCPSKYENATEALTVDDLLAYDPDQVLNKNLKVTGTVSNLSNATSSVRFTLDGTNSSLSIIFSGALSDDIADGSNVIVTGALKDEQGNFLASEVSIAK
jgi:cytochrome c-type biogenesis protein CcmE